MDNQIRETKDYFDKHLLQTLDVKKSNSEALSACFREEMENLESKF